MTKPNPKFISPESDLFPEDAAPSDPTATRQAFITRSRSGYTKIRHELIQKPVTAGTARSTPAMLPNFARNHRAAVLYLAVLSNWTWLVRSGEALPADTWIRFLSSEKTGSLTWTAQSLSHAWKVLEEARLVERELKNRLKAVTPLHESGSGAMYMIPDGTKTGLYFALPHEFWSRELHATLKWPALAVLLILLKESSGRPSAELAVDRAEKYYGISRSTAEQGLSELRAAGLLISRNRWVQDHDAGEGRRWTSLHALTEPFSLSYRQGLQAAAQQRRDAAAESKRTSTKRSTKKGKATRKKKKAREAVKGEHSETVED